MLAGVRDRSNSRGTTVSSTYPLTLWTAVALRRISHADPRTPISAPVPLMRPWYQWLHDAHLANSGPEHAWPLWRSEALLQMNPYSRIETISGARGASSAPAAAYA